MVAECWSIILVLSVLSLVLRSRGLSNLNIGVLPLFLLPLTHLAAGPISRMVSGEYAVLVRVGMDLAAVVISCVLIGVLAHTVRSKRARQGYYLLCIGFTVLLSMLLICSIYA